MGVPVSSALTPIAAQTGASTVLHRGDVLRLVATHAEQVADLALFLHDDPRDAFSPGRTMDYTERLVPRVGDVLYSHRSTPLATIVEDTVGVHDQLLTPCSRRMFERRGEFGHPSCHENLVRALARFGLDEDDVTASFNVWMDVRVENNAIRLYPPPSRPSDVFAIRAERDLIVAVTACSSELTNAGSCKPVAYEVVALLH